MGNDQSSKSKPSIPSPSFSTLGQSVQHDVASRTLPAAPTTPSASATGSPIKRCNESNQYEARHDHESQSVKTQQTTSIYPNLHNCSEDKIIFPTSSRASIKPPNSSNKSAKIEQESVTVKPPSLNFVPQMTVGPSSRSYQPSTQSVEPQTSSVKPPSSYHQSASPNVETRTSSVKTPSSYHQSASPNVETQTSSFKPPSSYHQSASPNVETQTSSVKPPSSYHQSASPNVETQTSSVKPPSSYHQSASPNVETQTTGVKPTSSYHQSASPNVETQTSSVKSRGLIYQPASSSIEPESSTVKPPNYIPADSQSSYAKQPRSGVEPRNVSAATNYAVASSSSADDSQIISRSISTLTPSAPRGVAPPPFKNVHAVTRGSSRGRSNSGSRSHKKDLLGCPSCSGQLGVNIFQCLNYHNSCENCLIRGNCCGICQSPITNVRNFSLQNYVAECRMPCPNASEGCTLSLRITDMETHTKQCPFKDIDCPLKTIFGNCSWKGKLSKLINHFDESHPENRQGNINQEMVVRIPCIHSKDRYIYLVDIGPYNFLVHLHVSEKDNNIYMTVQLVGTKNNAAKWIYELQIYSQKEPKRQYQFIDACHPIGTPVIDIFGDSKCAVVPLPYAMTFLDEGSLTYKFFIKKDFEREQYVRGGKGRGGKERHYKRY